MESWSEIIILSLDPGYTTGYAVGKTTGPRKFEFINAGEILFDSRFEELDRLFKTYQPHHVVIEDFILYKDKAVAQAGSRIPSSRIIGAVDYICFKYGIALTFQTASSRKSVRIPDAIKERFPSAHARDAYQHLRYYVILNCK